jgi:bacteriocin biosynthesis cyclodehydratase domain-containing protein
MDGRTSIATIMWTATRRGISTAVMTELLAELTTGGYLRPVRGGTSRTGAIRVHGQGPLSDSITQALRHGSTHIQRSHGYRSSHVVAGWRNVLVVLTDDVVTDPRLVADLVRCGIPHLAVHLRDGCGVVGPLVLPGHSSCLRCADITRAAHDPDWLHLAAQLLGSAGYAEPAMIHATTALALSEIESAITASEATPPVSLFSTLEIDLVPYRITTRRWPRQTSCSCHYLAPVTGAGGVRQT